MSSSPDASQALDFDLTDPEIKKNPFPTLQRLREEDPVHYVEPMHFWLVSRYEDIRQLFTDPRVSADRRQWEFYEAQAPPEGSYMRWIDDHGLMAVSPKEHIRQRRFLASGFTPRGVARMEGQIRDVVQRYADPLLGRRGVVDIMAEFTTPIPNAVISAITGVGAPGDAEERFSRLAQQTIQGFFGFVSAEVKGLAEASFEELAGWVRETIRMRRDDPRDDLISDLVNAKEGEDRLSDDNIVAQVAALLAAGSETTAISGMISITTLLEHPEQLERLRSDRGLIPQAVLEILRFGFAGLGGMQRFAVDDFELHGRKIRKGQMLLLSSGGASHDPSVYPDPERFDIDRNPRDLLTFGIGPHVCPGANLAKGELACMIDAALDFLPSGASVLRDEMETMPLGMFDRIITCPIDFGS
jgi:cytochrome P450 enzyme